MYYLLEREKNEELLENLNIGLEKDRVDLIFIKTYIKRLDRMDLDDKAKIDILKTLYYGSLVFMLFFCTTILPDFDYPKPLPRNLLAEPLLLIIVMALVVFCWLLIIGGILSTIIWILLIVRWILGGLVGPIFPELNLLQTIHNTRNSLLTKLNVLVFNKEIQTELIKQINHLLFLLKDK